MEYLDPIVPRVGDANIALVIDRDTPADRRTQLAINYFVPEGGKLQTLPWKFELALFGAFRAERGQHPPVHIEYLDPMVVRIGNDHAIRI